MTTLNERFQKGMETRSKFVGGGPIGSGSVSSVSGCCP